MNRKQIIIASAVVVGVIAATCAFISLGVYDFAADVPHTNLVADLIDFARDRSVEERAEDIVVPKLDDAKLIADGANHYAGMCTGCHLAPGMAENDMRQGMYPKPPVLALLSENNPAERFWIVKHGLKMSGMPAWGKTHSDEDIWAIVAFLQKLPGLTPEQYKTMTAPSGEHEHHMDEH
jgi:mono/diheme cytochrome c family protein